MVRRRRALRGAERLDDLTRGRGVGRDDPRVRGHAARHDPQRRPRRAAVRSGRADVGRRDPDADRRPHQRADASRRGRGALCGGAAGAVHRPGRLAATGLPAGDVADAAGDAGDDAARAEPRAAHLAGDDGRRTRPRAQQPRRRGAPDRLRSRRRARDPQPLDRGVRRVGDRARAGRRPGRPADAGAAVLREPHRVRRAGRGRPRGRVAGRAARKPARRSRGRWPSPTRPPASTGRSCSRSPTPPGR